MEIREWRMGAGRESGGRPAKSNLHPPGEPKFWITLDEGGGVVRQSEADEQVQRERANYAKFPAQIRASGSSGSRGRGGRTNGTISLLNSLRGL